MMNTEGINSFYQQLSCKNSTNHQHFTQLLLQHRFSAQLVLKICEHLEMNNCCLLDHIYYKFSKAFKKFLTLLVPKLCDNKNRMKKVVVSNMILKLKQIEKSQKFLLCCPTIRKEHRSYIGSLQKKERRENIQTISKLKQKDYSSFREESMTICMDEQCMKKKYFLYLKWAREQQNPSFDMQRKINLLLNQNSGYLFITHSYSDIKDIEENLKKAAQLQYSKILDEKKIRELYSFQVKTYQNQNYCFTIFKSQVPNQNYSFYTKVADCYSHPNPRQKFQYCCFYQYQSNIFVFKGESIYQNIHKKLHMQTPQISGIKIKNQVNFEFIERDIDRLRGIFNVYIIESIGESVIQNSRFLMDFLKIAQNKGTIFNVQAFLPSNTVSNPTIGVLITLKEIRVQPCTIIQKFLIKQMPNILKLTIHYLKQAQLYKLKFALNKWKNESTEEFLYSIKRFPNNNTVIQFQSGRVFLLSLIILRIIMKKKNIISDIDNAY